MKEERFDELFNEVARWVQQSRHLFIAGNALTEQSVTAFKDFATDRVGAVTQSPEFFEKAELVQSLSGGRSLLYGLSIENAAKARQIFDGDLKASNGEAKGLRKDHNLLEHVRQIGVALSPKEEEFLQLLTFQTKSLSKYPIAKSAKAQKEFVGRTVGHNAEDSGIIKTLVHRILKEDSLKAAFDHGHLAQS